MKVVVWKFPLKIADEVEIEIPRHARILHFDTQGHEEAPMVWALVDADEPKELRKFKMAATGEEAEGVHPGSPHWRYDYMGTIFFGSGRQLVFHGFAEMSPTERWPKKKGKSPAEDDHDAGD